MRSILSLSNSSMSLDEFCPDGQAPHQETRQKEHFLLPYEVL